jgi:hypothetical protein
MSYYEFAGSFSAFWVSLAASSGKIREPLNCSAQLGSRLHSHFMHYLAPVGFDRPFAHAKYVRDLLIGQAAHDELKYLALPGRQAFVTSTPVSLFPSHFSRSRTTRQRPLHRVEQIFSSNRLCQEIHSPALHRSHRGENIAMSRQKITGTGSSAWISDGTARVLIEYTKTVRDKGLILDRSISKRISTDLCLLRKGIAAGSITLSGTLPRTTSSLSNQKRTKAPCGTY